MKLGIMGAMEFEVKEIESLLKNVEKRNIGKKTFSFGETENGISVGLGISGIGKVSASQATTAMISAFDPDLMLFTGCAGAVDESIEVGDIVVANQLIQHDMDARPLCPRYEIPFTGVSHFIVKEKHLEIARISSERTIQELVPKGTFKRVSPDISPKVKIGRVASGDTFLHSREMREGLRRELPGVLCVEMEGAASAQVCKDYGVDFSCIRVISDNADDSAGVDFQKFIQIVLPDFSCTLARHYIANLTI